MADSTRRWTSAAECGEPGRLLLTARIDRADDLGLERRLVLLEVEGDLLVGRLLHQRPDEQVDDRPKHAQPQHDAEGEDRRRREAPGLQRPRRRQQHDQAEPDHAERAAQRELHAPAAPDLPDDVDQFDGRIGGAEIVCHDLLRSLRLSADAGSLAICEERLQAQQQQACKQQVPPDALGALLLLRRCGGCSRRPAAAPPARPMAPATSSCGSIGRQIRFRQIDVARDGQRGPRCHVPACAPRRSPPRRSRARPALRHRA